MQLPSGASVAVDMPYARSAEPRHQMKHALRGCRDSTSKGKRRRSDTRHPGTLTSKSPRNANRVNTVNFSRDQTKNRNQRDRCRRTQKSHQRSTSLRTSTPQTYRPSRGADDHGRAPVFSGRYLGLGPRARGVADQGQLSATPRNLSKSNNRLLTPRTAACRSDTFISGPDTYARACWRAYPTSAHLCSNRTHQLIPYSARASRRCARHYSRMSYVKSMSGP
jgi:hypothetical protein